MIVLRKSLRPKGDLVDSKGVLRRTHVIYVCRNKTGKAVRLELPAQVLQALESVPVPTGAPPDCPYYFWNGKGSRQTAAKAARRSLAKIFKLSGVRGARPHRFRHT